MSPPRILMIIQRFRPTFTGHGIQIEAMGRLLIEAGASVEIVTAPVAGAPRFEENDGLPIHRLPMPVTRNPWSLHRGSRELFAFIDSRRDQLDILHLHGAPAVFPFLIPRARRRGLQTVITTTLLSSDDPETLRKRGRLAAWRFRAYRAADAHVAICPALVESGRRAGLDPAGIAHIPVGVNVSRFHPVSDTETAAAELGWRTGVPRAFFMGLVLKRKGVDVLLDAWERVVAEMPEAELHIGGGYTFDAATDPAATAFAEACRERAARAPLAGRVHFHGNVTDPQRTYPAAHLFVFPSRLEGFPNVVLEALASGTPPVVTRIAGSTDESVQDGVTGYVVEQEDAAGMAARVLELFRDPAKRERFARAARADAEERYALERIADAHLDLYRGLLGR